VTHIDHVVKIAGIDHIGHRLAIFDGITSPPQGLEDISRMPYLTAALPQTRLLGKGRSQNPRRKLPARHPRRHRKVTQAIWSPVRVCGQAFQPASRLSGSDRGGGP